jgi:hypothetical protein
MAKTYKLTQTILQGRSDASIGFEELRSMLKSLGFEERIRGSHHIYRRADVEERLNLQRESARAKPYQVRQVRAVILKYRLGVDDDA